MNSWRALGALLLWSAAVQAEQVTPVISRPLTLPRGAVDLTLHGTYTNWSASASGASTSLAGETLALAADLGVTDDAQVGLAVALPIHPGASFGSVLGDALIASNRILALRADAGYERIGVNGAANGLGTHANRFFGGLGARMEVPISSTLAFVTGRSGAVQFGHFNNIGDGGAALYFGGSSLTQLSSDFLVVGAGDSGTSTILGINLPAGLLLQPDPGLAVTLHAGYSAIIAFPKSGSSQTLHFVPIGVEAIVSAAPALDLGARFFIDGYVASSGSGGGPGPGYFDMRALMFWIRIHA